MNKTPKSLRLHLAVAGRTNTGKSSFLNYITHQKVSITSPIAGTTTDVVEKATELLPLGPVVFLDTAGCDDLSELGGERIKQSNQALNRADIIFLLVEPGVWGKDEDQIAAFSKEKELPLIIVINKIDEIPLSDDFLEKMKLISPQLVACSTRDEENRGETIARVKNFLIEDAPEDYLSPPPLTEDLVPAGGHAVLIIPVDSQAPKGRLILPQVQTLRALLDNNSMGTVVQDTEYPELIAQMGNKTDLVICDSQVVDLMVRETPPEIPVTTFSILFSRYKGDLDAQIRGAAFIDQLKEDDRVLISEACSHHPLLDDIGRIKIPRWLQEYRGFHLNFEVVSGKDYPEDLSDYALIIHCGGCMLNRRGMLSRIEQAAEAGVPITNYGLAISVARGHFERVIEPFQLETKKVEVDCH